MISDLFDVPMLNRYYGGYVNTGDLPAAERALAAAWAAVARQSGLGGGGRPG